MTPSAQDRPIDADRSNWRTPPFNGWAFHNVGEILPVAAIANDPADVWVLRRGTSEAFDGFALPMVERPMDFAGFLEATATDGIVILRDGQIIHEAYANGMTAETPHILMSSSKAITGLVAGIAVERGRLDVDAPVSRYVPQIADGPFSAATVRQLLDMRTDIDFSAHDQTGYLNATGWEATPFPGLHAFFTGVEGEAKPRGGAFRYISANTDLLGWVIERATATPFADFAGKHFWKPLGAQGPALMTTDGHDAPRTSGGFCATVRDFAGIGQMVLQHGRRGETQVVPATWIADIETGGDPAAWAEGEWGALFGFAGTDIRYRAGWYAVNGAPAHLFAMGIHGQNLFIDRASGLVIAKVSSQNAPIDYRALPLTHWGVAEIRRLLA